MWENLAIGIVIFICILFAPFITIGVIFVMAGGWWKLFGLISIIIGIVRMIGKIND